MTDKDIIARIAEAIYLRRKQNNWCGDADSDWILAERVFNFFEGNVYEDRWMEERDREDYRWIYSLYRVLKDGASCEC